MLIIIISSFFFGRMYFVKPINVSLKWLNQAQFAGMYVAKDKGYYNWNGLDVSFKEFDFETSPMDDLRSGNAKFALMSAEEFLFHADKGEDVYAVAAFYQISPYALVSLGDSGIKTPADFKGKVLGTKGGKIEEELAYLLLLEGYGVSKNSVDIKMIGFEDKEMTDLLKNKADVIDVYRTDQLYFFEKDKINYNVIYPERYGVNLSNDFLVTTKKIVERNASQVEKFVQATVKGWNFTLENQDEAIDITMNYVTSEDYKNREYQKYILENSVELILPSSSSKIGFLDAEQINNLYLKMKEYNFIENEFNIEDFYTTTFLK